MKLNFAFIILALFSQIAFAQDYETIFKTERSKISPFDPKCRFSSEEESSAFGQSHADPDLQLSNDQLISAGFDVSIYEDQERGSKTCFMSLPEYAAITDYITVGYQLMNRALRNHDARAINDQKYKIKFLIAALDKVLPYEGWLKRGAEIHPDYLKDHRPGSIVTYDAFTSTSTAAGFSGNVRYLIYSHSCRPVPSYINYESEVICLPGTQFHILYRNDKDGMVDLMLEEIVK